MQYRRPTYLPVSARDPFASSKTLRTSLMPDEVALNSLKIQFASLARSLERVVFPHLYCFDMSSHLFECALLTHPGGPQNMILPRFPDPSRFLSNELGPVKCSCPTNSSSLCGRSLSARGALVFVVGSNVRLLAYFWPLNAGCVTAKDEVSTFRFFLDGPSEFISEEMAAELLPWP